MPLSKKMFRLIFYRLKGNFYVGSLANRTEEQYSQVVSLMGYSVTD